MTRAQICTVTTVVALVAYATPSTAQWLKTPTPGIPRTADGKPNLTAPAPKTSDGHTDLSGLWRAVGGGGFVLIPESNTAFSASGTPVLFHVDAAGVATDFVVHTVEGDQKYDRKK
jgi:hypothetical protein